MALLGIALPLERSHMDCAKKTTPIWENEIAYSNQLSQT